MRHMSVIALLAEIAQLDISVWVKGGNLLVKPASQLPAELATKLKANKAQIIEALTEPPVDPPILAIPPLTVNRAGRRLCGNGFPPYPKPEVDPRVIDTRRRCPQCSKRFILNELVSITGGRCWTCAHATGGSMGPNSP